MTKEEAITKIKAWDFLNNDEKEILETLIPELKESLDERIRKRIIALVNAHGQGMSKESMLDWLEKQGTSYTKRDVDDAYVEGMAFAKDELEKQKPAWSKKDDVMVHDILGWLPAKSRPEYNQRRVDWLKSLKGRVQPKQEWSEEDKNFMYNTLSNLTELKDL